MRFAGYAALFDRVDRGGDVVRPGAFARAVAAGPARVPLLWQHEPDRPVVEQTSPECRAALGDRRCRVDLGPRTRLARVAAVTSATVLEMDVAEPSAAAYAYGRLLWLDGPNGGLAALLAGSAGTTLTLRDAPPFAVTPGTLVRLTEGCDRALATCRDRFANAANFRGEPYLPGNDLLTRYPSA